MKLRTCKYHNTDYFYVCPECFKPFLANTEFSSLEEIREYQRKNAQNVKLIDLKSEYCLIGIIKIKLIGDLAYSGIQVYNIKEKKVLETKFKCFKPKFTDYFPTILFLNQTEIYLDLIKDLDYPFDCFIINSSGQIHPYLYGCACDFGLKIKTPVIGFTKTLLYGELRKIKQHPKIAGVYSEDILIGYGIPKPNSKKYLYISVGNNISLQSALELFLRIDLTILSKLSVDLNNFVQKKRI